MIVRGTPAATQTVCVYLFVLAYAGAWAYIGGPERPRFFFNEGGPVDSLSSILLATGAVLAGTLWLHARRTDDPDRRFWLLSSAGLTFLTLDERFQIHERLHYDVLEPAFGPLGWNTANWNDLVVIAYGLVAVSLLVFILPSVMRNRGTRTFLAVGFAFAALQVLVDLVLAGAVWEKCVEETFKLLMGASFMLAYLHTMMARRSLRRPGFGPTIAFFLVTLVFAGLFLVGGDASPDSFERKWGDPVRWTGMVYLGVATAFFWFTRKRGSSLGVLFWLASGVVFAGLTLGEIAVASATSFRVGVRRESLSEATVARLRLLDQALNLRTVVVLAVLAGLVALACRMSSEWRRSSGWLLLTLLAFAAVLTANTLFPGAGESWSLSVIRLTGCTGAFLAGYSLLTSSETS
jgi:hypothetical protein